MSWLQAFEQISWSWANHILQVQKTYIKLHLVNKRSTWEQIHVRGRAQHLSGNLPLLPFGSHCATIEQFVTSLCTNITWLRHCTVKQEPFSYRCVLHEAKGSPTDWCRYSLYNCSCDQREANNTHRCRAALVLHATPPTNLLLFDMLT